MMIGIISLLNIFHVFYISLASPGKPEKKKAVARKSTTLNTGQVWESPWLKIKDKKPSLKIQPQGNIISCVLISHDLSRGLS